MAITWKNSCFILSKRSDFHMVDSYNCIVFLSCFISLLTLFVSAGPVCALIWNDNEIR